MFLQNSKLMIIAHPFQYQNTKHPAARSEKARFGKKKKKRVKDKKMEKKE